MLWTLFIGCLFVAVGNGGAKPLETADMVGFFNNLFYFQTGLGDQAHFYIEGDLVGVTGGSDGGVKVGLTGPLGVIENGKVSYPDSNTKLCTMEVAIPDGITIDSIKGNGLKLKLIKCRVLLQFSVSNKTGVTIKPELVLVYGCTIKESDGSLSPSGQQVTQGLSKLLKNKADEYLAQHYDSADSFSYDYFTHNQPTVEELQDILDTILIIA